METDAPRPPGTPVLPQATGACSGIFPEPEDAVVRARALCRVFQSKKQTVTALHALDVDIPAGRMTALVGPDGAGKTTFLRMACGLLAPSAGSRRSRYRTA